MLTMQSGPSFSLGVTKLHEAMKVERGEETNLLPPSFPTLSSSDSSNSEVTIVSISPSGSIDIASLSRLAIEIEEDQVYPGSHLELDEIDEALQSLNDIVEEFNDMHSEPLVPIPINAPVLSFLNKDANF